MLNRTKDSSAAHGILAIFLLLLSASQGFPVAENEEEAPPALEQTTETAVAATENSHPNSFRHMSFASELINICPSGRRRNGGASPTRLEGEALLAQYEDISEKASNLLSIVNNTLMECPCDAGGRITTLLVNTTALEVAYLKGMDPSEAIKTVFNFSMLHTARVLYIKEAIQGPQISCSYLREEVNNRWPSMVTSQKYVPCLLSYIMNPEDVSNITQNVLNMQYIRPTEESRWELDKCQVVTSVLHLANAVRQYFNDLSV